MACHSELPFSCYNTYIIYNQKTFAVTFRMNNVWYCLISCEFDKLLGVSRHYVESLAFRKYDLLIRYNRIGLTAYGLNPSFYTKCWERSKGDKLFSCAKGYLTLGFGSWNKSMAARLSVLLIIE